MSAAAARPTREPRPKEVATRLLRESKGLFTDKIVAALVAKETGAPLALADVARVRKEGKFPKAQTGKRPRAVLELLARYGYQDKKQPSPTETKNNGGAMNSDAKLEEAIVATLRQAEEKVVVPFAVSRLVLIYENGAWADPEVERLTVTKATIHVPRRGR